MLPIKKITPGRRIKRFGTRGTILSCTVLKQDEERRHIPTSSWNVPKHMLARERKRQTFTASILAKMDHGVFVGGSQYQFELVKR